MRYVFSQLLKQRAVHGRSAAAEFGEEIGHTEKDPHHQKVGAEGQQGERVQEAGVQPEVTHWQQAAQVLLDHPLPRTNAAESWVWGSKKVGGRERWWRREEGGWRGKKEEKGGKKTNGKGGNKWRREKRQKQMRKKYQGKNGRGREVLGEKRRRKKKKEKEKERKEMASECCKQAKINRWHEHMHAPR